MLRLPLAARRAPRLLLPRPPARTLFGWSKKPTQTGSGAKPILTQDNLFHPLSESPIKTLQLRAKAVKELAPCPRIPLETGYRPHTILYPSSRVNEDEHDIRSGRKMTEFELPGQQSYEEAVSFANWDVFWYTRSFNSIDTDRSRRHSSKLLTYPITIASLLHENSGINIRNQRLTPEGLRSMTGNLHAESPTGDEDPSGKPPMRIFIIGARAESSLPTHVWEQLAHLFPNTPFHIYMIGPQVSLPAIAIPPPPPKPAPTKNSESTRDAPKPVLFEPPIPPQTTPTGPTKTRDSAPDYGVPSSTSSVSDQLTITCLRAPYADVHAHFAETFDPYTDVFFAFCPGFGFPSPTSPDMLQILLPENGGRPSRSS
ncbi:Mss51-mRNA processing-like protein [Rhizoctonia solani]|uniref:Mss51-mRNA processing-like protein n=1 Tax=Rhizoctonia solani TaxID=456999 RepID=A0A8H8PD36_9AGAM|nr:Mss51-mRNA processing-like protein [Rhizoctonia solani]QRW27497.1 Mss51-mRNA processing-like protein [Rhizoctonia solani]